MLLFSSNCPCDVRNRCQPVEPSPGVRCVSAHRDTRVTGRAGTVSIVVPVYNRAAALQSAMGADTARKVSAFRAFRTDIREAFADYRSPFPSIDVLLTWGTTSFGTVSVDHRPRLVGSSNYTFRRLVTHAVNMMTGFSVRPLQLASFIGFGFALFGVGVLVYAV